jgi:hypothetical protein
MLSKLGVYFFFFFVVVLPFFQIAVKLIMLRSFMTRFQ